MILIFTGDEQIDYDISKKIENSRVVYYPDYILQEPEADILIATVQPNKYNFTDFMFKVREKNIRVILLLENNKAKVLKDALILGIYDILFDTFTIEDIEKLIKEPSSFSFVSQYVKELLDSNKYET